jgi:chitodextrinase
VAPTTTTTVTVDRTAPTTPVGVLALPNAGKVSVSWKPSVDSGGSGLAGYEVYRGPSRSGPFVKVATVTGTGFVDMSVVPRTQYAYYVKAYDRAGNVSAGSGTAVVYVT